MQEVKLEVSLRSLLIVFFAVVASWLLYQIKEVIIILVFSFIFVSALNPLVEQLEKKMPRFLGIVLLYLGVIITLALLLAVIIPTVITQIGVFFRNFPYIVDKAISTVRFLGTTGDQQNVVLSTQNIVGVITDQLTKISSDFFNLTFGFVNVIVALVAIGVFSFYLLLEHRTLEKQFLNLFPVENEERIFNLILKIETKLGLWMRGQVLLCFIIGLLAWIGLSVLRVDFALPLAIIAGFLEIIPNIGPAITLILASLVALVASPLQALLTAVWFLLIQQAENAFIVPRIMSSAVNLNPLVIILAILIGGKLMGVVGVLLSIPMMAVCSTLLEDYLEHRKSNSS